MQLPAVIIAWTGLSGGFGNMGGTVIGVINNLLSLLNVDSNLRMVVKGFIILGAVIIDQSARKR